MGLLNAIGGRKVYLDSNIFVYTVEDVTPWAEQTVAVLEAVDHGELTAVTSELSLAEALVKPFQLDHEEAIRAYRGIFQSRDSLTVVPITSEILLDAARLRGVWLRTAEDSRPKLPDAIHAATARAESCEVLLTNDLRFQAFKEIETLFLRDFIDPDLT